MKEVNSLKNILKKTKAIAERHEKIEKESGYKFNIFTVTKIERMEVNTHSAMIAELLNPNGSHGQGNIFLIKFIDCINKYIEAPSISKNTIDYSSVKTTKEKSFRQGEDRVDIYIEFNNHILLIENKIDAIDGEKQLKRYSDIGEKSDKTFSLIYLTKYGNEANINSHCGKTYEKLSYKEHIVEWLEECIKEVALVPIVREGILQYLNLVKKITGISMTHEFKNEIVDLLLDGDNLQHAQKISDSIIDAKRKILFEFFKKLELNIKDKKPEYTIISNIDEERLYSKQKCIDWFNKGKGKTKTISIGIFIDISIPGILFHIEVATFALHYGVVKVTKSSDTPKNQKYIIDNSEIDNYGKFERRNWEQFKWYSCIYDKNVSKNIDSLMKPNEFIDEIFTSISETKKVIEIRK